MSNTVDATLTTSQLAANSVPPAEGFVCPIANIATRARPLGPPRTGKVRCSIASSASSTDSNPANFQENGDASLLDVDIDVDHIVRRFHVRATEGNQGLTTAGHLFEPLIREFEKDVFDLVTLQIQTSYFGDADVSASAAAFSTANLKTLIEANSGNPRTLLVAKAAFLNLAGDLTLGADGLWRYPGVDGGVYEASLSGDGHTVLAGPTALAWHMERPTSFDRIPPNEINVREIVLPRLKIAAWSCWWFDLRTRTNWLSVEGLFGVGKADVGALTFAADP